MKQGLQRLLCEGSSGLCCLHVHRSVGEYLRQAIEDLIPTKDCIVFTEETCPDNGLHCLHRGHIDPDKGLHCLHGGDLIPTRIALSSPRRLDPEKGIALSSPGTLDPDKDCIVFSDSSPRRFDPDKDCIVFTEDT